MVLTTLALLAPLVYTTAVNALPFESGTSRHARRQSGGANWNALACYTDNVAVRTFTGAELVSESMTTSMCQNFCYSKGYKYAGTEWGKECFCDNSFQNGGSQTDSGCNMPCTGAAGETCGGGLRLSVYENTGTLSPPEPTYPGWSSKGCYTDSVANRALPHQVSVDGDMTVGKCTSECFNQGFAYAGVEFARECFCGGSIGASGVPTTDGCDMPCTGSSNEICGGGDRLNVYQYTGASPLPSTGYWTLEGEAGCYTDVIANRALGLRVYVEGAMTVPKCTDKCLSLKYGYAGVEFGDECYCSDGIASSGVPASDGCTMPCSGDMSTICGGPDRITVYRYRGKNFLSGATVLSSYNDFTSQGCYSDSVQSRIMTEVAVAGEMTVEKCIDACYADGHQVAGVEFGTECFCSAGLPADSFKATANCNMPCAGDPDHLCGGANRLNVYRYQAPVTTTTPTSTDSSTSTSETSTSTSRAPAQTIYNSVFVQGDGNYVLQGCYVDSASARLMTRMTMAKPVTVENCFDACDAAGYAAAGVEAGSECYCATSFPVNAQQVALTECTERTCAGDPTEYCGDGNRLIGYLGTPKTPTSTSTSTSAASSSTPTPATYSPWEYRGCMAFSESQPGWAGGSLIYPPHSQVVANNDGRSCMQWCEAMSYQTAMVVGQTCRCSPSAPQFYSIATGTCTTTCPGNPLEVCGGGDINQAGGSVSIYVRSYQSLCSTKRDLHGRIVCAN